MEPSHDPQPAAKHTHNTKAITAVVVIVVLCLGFLLVTNVFVNSAPQPYVPDTQPKTKTLTSDDTFYVSAANDIIFSSSELTAEEAQAACEAVAYDPDHMWKQVVCVFAGEEIYNDIFIAG